MKVHLYILNRKQRKCELLKIMGPMVMMSKKMLENNRVLARFLSQWICSWLSSPE